jgi:ribonuclease BN (tRNA processing enzyme)
MIIENRFTVLPLQPPLLARKLFERGRRVLLLGAPGVGKSTLAGKLGAELFRRGQSCACISADPGSPLFGVPGSVSLGAWERGGWDVLSCEALCTLDAGRFRLPLVDAVRRLATRAPPGPLLIDAPGVVRGVAGAELLLALVPALAADTVLCLARDTGAPPLAQELAALAAEVLLSPADPAARRPGKRARERARTRLWDSHLATAAEYNIPIDQVRILGTPPPAADSDVWAGRQVALLDGGCHATLGLGEIVARDATTLTLRTPLEPPAQSLLLIRDAQRLQNGLLASAASAAPGTGWFAAPPDLLPPPAGSDKTGPRPLVRVGAATATLVNGIFGDPLLHLRLRHDKRSLLFDLGESARLPARIAHQISDVFVSHAHFDHIGGFLWLLRSRIGVSGVCRLYGPPGLTRHIMGLISGIRWDRIGARGPRFEITELHADHLVRHRLQTGQATAHFVEQRQAPEGILLQDNGFRVQAVTLDHGIPVLAFAFETTQTLNVRKERLAARGWQPGAWLGNLKRAVHEQRPDAVIQLPDGSTSRAGELVLELLRITPGQKLVYATDLADTSANRKRLIAFARGADTFLCEAAFLSDDLQQSLRTGHLTARACGEIASAAQVKRLVPFHFSRRYQDDPLQVYAEVQGACARTVMPGLTLPRAS